MSAIRRTALLLVTLLLLAPVGILAENPSLWNVLNYLIYGLFALLLQVVMVIGIFGGVLYFLHQISRRA